MHLIIGLGNPGKNYEITRHNAGFMVLDEILKNPEIVSADEKKLKLKENKRYGALMAETRVDGEPTIFAKPLMFMNNSGQTVAAISNFYKVKAEDIWVIHDEIDLPLGIIKIKHSGSSAGHKGVEDIIQKLGSDEFGRIRIGVAQISGDPNTSDEPRSNFDTKEYVLEKFTTRELSILNNVIKKASIYVTESIKINRLIATTIKVTEKDKLL